VAIAEFWAISPKKHMLSPLFLDAVWAISPKFHLYHGLLGRAPRYAVGGGISREPSIIPVPKQNMQFSLVPSQLQLLLMTVSMLLLNPGLPFWPPGPQTLYIQPFLLELFFSFFPSSAIPAAPGTGQLCLLRVRKSREVLHFNRFLGHVPL
jgi:hypothetical protein